MLAAKNPIFEPLRWPKNDNEDFLDGLDCLRIIYEGKDVEGEVLPEFIPPKDPVYKEIVFSLDGKKYMFMVEEMQE